MLPHSRTVPAGTSNAALAGTCAEPTLHSQAGARERDYGALVELQFCAEQRHLQRGRVLIVPHQEIGDTER